MSYYSRSLKTIFKELESFESGLTTGAAGRRLHRFGANELPFQKPPTKIRLAFRQLKSPLIFILLIAAGITFLLSDLVDTWVILAAVFINTILGFVQEYKAENSLEALKKVFTPTAKVKRDGQVLAIESKYLVPGDVIILEPGHKIPADARLTRTTDLFINEAALTGESVPVKKSTKIIKKVDLPLGDRKNMVYWGTGIISGFGEAVVCKTGKNSELGKIAKEIADPFEARTPLQESIAQFSNKLALIVFIFTIIIFLVGILFGKDRLEMFVTSVALAVSAIPEGLAVAITAILAVGMQRILKKKALVRKLVAAETLGSITVICTDKTGTLTEGLMQIVKKDVKDEKEFLNAATLANNLNDPEEIILWEYAQGRPPAGGFDPQKLTDNAVKIDELPFSSERKFMGSLVELSGERFIYMKGAPEIVLERCKMGVSKRGEWEEKVDKWSGDGVRVFGFAYKKVANNTVDINLSLRSGFEFIGVVGFFDPIRRRVKSSLAECARAGIDVKVITGDYRLTAEAVMRKIGLKFKSREIMEGKELGKLTPEDLLKKIKNIKLFARVSPSDKLIIVNALKDAGEVVAMTGDGINDAPALKRADIGIVVGSATEVAREAADLVLLDSNFKTIVDAVAEGRGIFENLRKIILYLLSDSFTEIILVVGSFVLSLPLPITAAQILWVNLIDDGLPGLSLVFEPKDEGVMKEPPRGMNKGLLDLEIKSLITLISIVSGVATLAIFFIFFKVTGNLMLARTVTFTALGVDSLLYIFSSRSLRKPIWKTRIFKNKYLIFAVLGGFIFQLAALYLPALQKFLLTKSIGLFEWGVIAIEAVLVITVIEVTKLIFLKTQERSSLPIGD